MTGALSPHALPPEEFRPPARLAKVPEHLVVQAVNNIAALVDYDTAKSDEVVRRVLAALHLAAPDMPDTPVDHYPDGSPADPPIGASSGARCQWGKLRRGGDVVMCALDEDFTDGEPGPGHIAPGEHAFRPPGGDDHFPFTEDDPRAFHALTWPDCGPGEERPAADAEPEELWRLTPRGRVIKEPYAVSCKADRR